MWYQFLLENFHFAVNLFAALAFFAIFWLYADAWWERKTFKEGLKITGFLLLSLSFLAHSVLVETTSLATPLLGGGVGEKISIGVKIVGYIFLILGLIIDPLIPKPKLAIGVAISNRAIPLLLTPVLTAIAAWLYLRRATLGLENHTKKVSLAFFLFSIYELLTVPILFGESLNVDIFRLVAPFGPLWIVAHGVLLIGSAVLIKWAFSYLLKRINTQLFIIFTTTILSIFLLTTVSFTLLLLKNLSDETLARLKTDVSVLSFALDTKKSEALSGAYILSQNSKVAEAITNKDKKTLSTLAEELLLSKKLSSVVIVDEMGQVVARGEEKDRIGDSLSNDSLVKRALVGENLSSLVTREAVLAPVVMVRAMVPIKLDDKVVGVTIVALSLDNNFLDGIKQVTGLEVGVYGGEILSATTISDLSGTTRPIGIRESNKEIKNIVLTKGEDFSGLISLLNASYFAVYHPLKDVNNEVVGMLLAGKPSNAIFLAAGKSIELTFLVTVALIILSTFPSFYISKYIFNQLK